MDILAKARELYPSFSWSINDGFWGDRPRLLLVCEKGWYSNSFPLLDIELTQAAICEAVDQITERYRRDEWRDDEEIPF